MGLLFKKWIIPGATQNACAFLPRKCHCRSSGESCQVPFRSIVVIFTWAGSEASGDGGIPCRAIPEFFVPLPGLHHRVLQ